MLEEKLRAVVGIGDRHDLQGVGVIMRTPSRMRKYVHGARESAVSSRWKSRIASSGVRS